MQRVIQSVRQAMVYNFEDVDNAPAEMYVPKTPPDVTFFRQCVKELSFTIFDEHAALSLSLPQGVNVDISTWATRSFQSAIAVVVPQISVELLHEEAGKWVSVATVQADLAMDVFNAPSGWQEKVAKQQKFIREEDAPTRRIAFMYDEKHKATQNPDTYLPYPCNVDSDSEPEDEESSSSSQTH